MQCGGDSLNAIQTPGNDYSAAGADKHQKKEEKKRSSRHNYCLK